MGRSVQVLVPIILSVSLMAAAETPGGNENAFLLSLYKHLHANPELSFQEAETAARLGDELEILGFRVTRKVGGHGIVGVMKNGDGPTVLLRTDLDALPVAEATGLPYASEVTATDDKGRVVPVMHACGHDMHMTVFIGTARVLAAQRKQWRGTLVMIGQPAEERGAGARAMLADGLFERFPRPDYNLALHVSPDLPAGTVGFVPGWAMANVDSVDIQVRGIGGHGAAPHAAKDPVVLAASIVMNLQTLVSRTVDPLEQAVVTVGSIHGGTKHNIIPDQVDLQLTVRSYSDDVRKQLLTGIERIAVGQARAQGFPEDRLPVVTVKDEYTPALWNDPELTENVAGVLRDRLGEENVIRVKPVMGGEDFARYGRVDPAIPSLMLRLGTVDPETWRAFKAGNGQLASLHSPQFAPAPEATLATGVTAMTAAARSLLATP